MVRFQMETTSAVPADDHRYATTPNGVPMTRATRLGIAMVVVTMAAGASVAEDGVPKPYCTGGFTVVRDDLGFSYRGPTIVTDENDPSSPSYALATINTPNEKRRLLFLIVFDNGGNPVSDVAWIRATGPTINGRDITDTLTAIIDHTKKISFAVSYSTEDKSRETVSINGKVLDEKAPHVFRVDLTEETPKLIPIEVPLPKSVPNFHRDDGTQTGREWRMMIKALKESSPELRTFIEGYGK